MQHAIICNLCARQRQTAFLRRDSRTQEPAMEGLTRLVSESMARHGFDRPLDYRRLHWSRWFRCESHHSLLFIPSKPGVFAIAEEITHVAPAASAVPRSEASGPVWDHISPTTPDVESGKPEAEPHRMLAVTQFFEDDDMA